MFKWSLIITVIGSGQGIAPDTKWTNLWRKFDTREACEIVAREKNERWIKYFVIPHKSEMWLATCILEEESPNA